MKTELADVLRVIPVSITSLGAMVCVLLGASSKPHTGRSYFMSGCVAVLLIALTAVCLSPDTSTFVRIDGFSRLASSVLLIATAIIVAFSERYTTQNSSHRPAYYGLVLTFSSGFQAILLASDLITLVLGLEIVFLSTCFLTALLPQNEPRIGEATVKYLILGALSTAFIVFGITCIYGATGQLNYEAIARSLPSSRTPFFRMGLGLVLVGMAGKVSTVPFHMWTADTCQSAPPPIAGLLIGVVKSVVFLGMIRLIIVVIWDSNSALLSIEAGLAWLAGLSIVVGSSVSLIQRNVKRIFAYTSIIHTGYLLLGMVNLVDGDISAPTAVFFYLSTYLFALLGVMGVLTYFERTDVHPSAGTLQAFQGAGYKHPVLGVLMLIFVSGLAGAPPSGLFLAKILILSSLIESGEFVLTVLGGFGWMALLYTYLRFAMVLYTRESSYTGPSIETHPSASLRVGLFAATIICSGLILTPSEWLRVVEGASQCLYSSTFAPKTASPGREYSAAQDHVTRPLQNSAGLFP